MHTPYLACQCWWDVVGSLPRSMPTVVNYRWRCARQRTRWWRKINIGFFQVRVVNCVIPYILHLHGLYWCVMMCFEGGSLPALYSTGGKVIDLRNLVLIGYNSYIHGGYNIYHNRLGFVDRQVVSACSAQIAKRFRDPRGPFWRVGPPCIGAAHVEPWGYTGLYPHSGFWSCSLRVIAV
jgi:hypothetical protein